LENRCYGGWICIRVWLLCFSKLVDVKAN
jgi:hypothetical protein